MSRSSRRHLAIWSVTAGVVLLMVPAQGSPAEVARVQVAPTMHVSPTRWRVVELAGIRSERNADYDLSGVSCPTTTFCLIAGTETYPNQSRVEGIVEDYSGHSWRRLFVGRRADTFDTVACAAADFCAVGGSDAHDDPLIEMYDHGRWLRWLLPGVGEDVSAVACPTAGACVAVGWSYSRAGVFVSWAFAHGRWRKVPVHPGIEAYVGMASVSCVSSTDCTGVGHYGGGGPGGAGIVEHFNGSHWGAAEIQSAWVYRGGFGDVSCTRRGLCVATEDLSWQLRSGDIEGGLAGIVSQIRIGREWKTLGRGLPGPDQRLVAQGGVQCFLAGWCVVDGGSDTGMFVGIVNHGRLSPLSVVRGVHLNGAYPDVLALSCAKATMCVEVSDNLDAPYVLAGNLSG